MDELLYEEQNYSDGFHVDTNPDARKRNHSDDNQKFSKITRDIYRTENNRRMYMKQVALNVHF